MEKTGNPIRKVISAMTAMQRFPWEQGTAAQSLYEMGLDELWIPMAYDAVKRQSRDGRLALVGGIAAVSDPAVNGEVCIRAYEKTKDPFFKEGYEKMLSYLLKNAPRTKDGIICHNNVSFQKEFSAKQLWIDGLYMVPPFLACAGLVREAYFQIQGYIHTLFDPKASLFFHIADTEQERFVRKLHWATGNGWAAMGIARVLEEAEKAGEEEIREKLLSFEKKVLSSMISLAGEDGRFHDILDDPSSFIDGTSSMMAASAVYRGIAKGYLPKEWKTWADRSFNSVSGRINSYGLLYEVCGCPDFMKSGTSCEAQAAYLMSCAWKEKAEAVS